MMAENIAMRTLFAAAEWECITSRCNKIKQEKYVLRNPSDPV